MHQDLRICPLANSIWRDDKILEKMNRHYTSAHYLKLIDKIRKFKIKIQN